MQSGEYLSCGVTVRVLRTSERLLLEVDSRIYVSELEPLENVVLSDPTLEPTPPEPARRLLRAFAWLRSDLLDIV